MKVQDQAVLDFREVITKGIPKTLPPAPVLDLSVSHAPVRKDILTVEDKKQALKNALRYFDPIHHEILAGEFADELRKYGRIYMYRFRPDYIMYARPLDHYPSRCSAGAALMAMIQNNLDPNVAQHPHELITYGGNGAVFQNWVQYLVTMKYLSEMTDTQTLHMYSGHPMGLFPSGQDAPRVVVTNGMMIPNYSTQDDWERYNAMGVTQYGQMTAGSYMYIGPQGIVHGTTITILNAGRKISKDGDGLEGKIFVSSGLGGMSGAQPKAASIAGCISVVAEVNEKAVQKRHEQGWVDEVYETLPDLIQRIHAAREKLEVVSLAYIGNVVDLWEALNESEVQVDLGSDQTSLHNPWSGGYYPAGMDFNQANNMMATDPDRFREAVQESLRRHVTAINRQNANGMYFFDYGNAFLLESSRAGAEIMNTEGSDFRYPSYVQDIMGPICFDFGFGPFRWVCMTQKQEDLDTTDRLALEVLKEMTLSAPVEIRQQLDDNIHWIESASENNLVVGSKARILYADAEGRIAIAKRFNQAIADGVIGPVVLGRDHHDVSGTDSPYRETSNIYDGSRFTADMAIQNVIGDSFRGATWVSIHNGGGVGWGEVINGGFGMLLDGSQKAGRNIENMMYWDVLNGLARRSWAGNPGAQFAVSREMKKNSGLVPTIAHQADEGLINQALKGSQDHD